MVTGQQTPHQLNGCHVFFPPKVGLSHRAKGRQSIVEIHDNMHTGVYHGMERAHSTCGRDNKTGSGELSLWFPVLTPPMALTTYLGQPLPPTTSSREALSDGKHAGKSPAHLSSGE